MIDHVSIAVSDLARSTAFYEQVLAPLGLTLMVPFEDRSGFGKRYPEFWLNLRPGLAPVPRDTGIHICLRAPSDEAVSAFHAAALANGGADAGEPGPRLAAMTTYFGAFIFDPDGNKLEAVCFPKAE
ncbi:VOC family protein [Oleomonas cavernae]|uniref:VOC family protein n=1 Tax=Oleomonas cavernae TaxID=2320859 RepID=A0A418WBT3_9PROT|nr:VOC family protein [Oleomonas cavernae]RJF87388.1 VOC family protein [Oleomonas cavernae]